ncbi:hypothetical protein BK816_01730 [Boudabousia tangfeifanii]|uniref:SLH domain-containing protein n=1 Tax=Boudabousia tangfeifanii TaxID=1912795 RepID=A0A1D9MIQ1_9ACTO|nr:leucine-rich repeat domain-containing protein [Boudabousia tangfeifanii]AOZ72174.1 hypothetical protein BK816_01730 [Boudabousia tangfeifanii]
MKTPLTAITVLSAAAIALTPLPLTSTPVAEAAYRPRPTLVSAPKVGGKFVDVPKNMLFSGEMAWLANARISTGWEGKRGREYRPLNQIERQAMAAFLYRLAGMDRSGYRPPKRPTFKDVPRGSQFYKQVEWMASTGITTGWKRGKDRYFGPHGAVNRDAMAAFLARFVKKYPSRVSPAIVALGQPGKQGSGRVFRDVPAKMQFSAEMEWLRKTEVSTGWKRGKNRFYRPLEPIRRDAMAAFLYRLKFNRFAEPTAAEMADARKTVTKSCWVAPNMSDFWNRKNLECEFTRYNYAINKAANERIRKEKLQEFSMYVGNPRDIIDEILIFPTIKSFGIMGTKATSVPNFSRMPNVTHLILKGNQLRSLPNFSHLPKLTHLNVNENQLRSLPNFTHLPKLYNLEAERNQLSSVPNFSKIPQLSYLEVSSNKLKALPDFRYARELFTLKVESNQLTALPDFRSTNLRVIHADKNRISKVPNWKNLRNLQSLYLKNNQIKSMPNFYYMDELKYVHLQNNPLKKCPTFPDSLRRIKVSC